MIKDNSKQKPVGHSANTINPSGQQTKFDVIIIGGGINGAGIARDCALRGLKVLILDKGDFASGTSSKSTKLVHGGIRYLENFEFKLVWEALHERKILTQIAPHLVKPIPFVIPVYKGDKRPLWMVRLGMFLYDVMAGLKNIHRHVNLSAAQIGKILPGVKTEGLKGGGIYYDCQTDDARLTLANIKDAVAHGAEAKNYTEVVNIKWAEHKMESTAGLVADPDGGLGAEVICQDVLTTQKFTYTAKIIVNATGPWLDQNLQKWKIERGDGLNKAINGGSQLRAQPELGHSSELPAQRRPLLRLTKGIHFFVPRLTTPSTSQDHALLISAQKDNRVFFIIPHGQFSLVGTTDTDYKADPDKVASNQEDIQYLLDELNRLFPEQKLTQKYVVASYAGLRPLVNNEGVKEGKITREYKIKEQQRRGATILTIVGGKLTTYRSLAQKVTDRICEVFGEQEMIEVEKQNGLLEPKEGGKSVHVHSIELRAQPQKKCQTAKLPLPVSPLDLHMVKNADGLCKPKSGTKSVHVNRFAKAIVPSTSPAISSQIIPESPVTWEDLTYSIKHEFVRTAEDFINRRSELYLYLKNHPDLNQKVQSKI